MDPKRSMPGHIIVKMPKVKDKEKNLKAARENQLVTGKGIPIRLSVYFQKKLCRLKGTGIKYSK